MWYSLPRSYSKLGKPGVIGYHKEFFSGYLPVDPARTLIVPPARATNAVVTGKRFVRDPLVDSLGVARFILRSPMRGVPESEIRSGGHAG